MFDHKKTNNTMNTYRVARRLFFQMEKDEAEEFPSEAGKRIRQSLYVLVNRHPEVQKQFRTKKVSSKKIRIWRKI